MLGRQASQHFELRDDTSAPDWAQVDMAASTWASDEAVQELKEKVQLRLKEMRVRMDTWFSVR